MRQLCNILKRYKCSVCATQDLFLKIRKTHKYSKAPTASYGRGWGEKYVAMYVCMYKRCNIFLDKLEEEIAILNNKLQWHVMVEFFRRVDIRYFTHIRMFQLINLAKKVKSNI